MFFGMVTAMMAFAVWVALLALGTVAVAAAIVWLFSRQIAVYRNGLRRFLMQERQKTYCNLGLLPKERLLLQQTSEEAQRLRRRAEIFAWLLTDLLQTAASGRGSRP